MAFRKNHGNEGAGNQPQEKKLNGLKPLPPDRIPTKEQKRLDATLLAAVRAGSISMVRRLLDEGADPNARDEIGWTPLMRAAEEGFASIARLLLDKGADANAMDNEGWTAKGIALYSEQDRMARLLEKFERTS